MSVYYPSRPPSSDFYRVCTGAQAAILDDQALARFFYPFLAQEKTVTQAAEEVGCKLNAMHYRVQTFLEAGLLRVTKEQKRAGRPIKVYCSVTDAFFVPFDLTSHITQEQNWLAYIEPVTRRLARSMAEQVKGQQRAGQCVFRDSRNNVVSLGGREVLENSEIVFHADSAEQFRATDRCGNIFLTADEAHRLKGELVELFARYLQLWHSDAQVRREHVFLYAFAPAPTAKE